MKVKLQILKGSKIVEEYTVPDGSWVQTETLGAQHVPAIIEPKEITGYPECVSSGKCTAIRFIPVNPPKIPAKVTSLLDSRDPKWGKNGFEWQGSHRASSGGTVLDRAREMCWRLTRITEFPLKDDPDVAKFCETGLR